MPVRGFNVPLARLKGWLHRGSAEAYKKRLKCFTGAWVRDCSSAAEERTGLSGDIACRMCRTGHVGCSTSDRALVNGAADGPVSSVAGGLDLVLTSRGFRCWLRLESLFDDGGLAAVVTGTTGSCSSFRVPGSLQKYS